MNKDIITRKDFIEIINEIQLAYDYQDELNKFFEKHSVDGYIFQPDCICAATKLLHLIFGEKDLDEWISYFCFELNFGRKYKPGMVQALDGKDIVLATADDLYDLLTE